MDLGYDLGEIQDQNKVPSVGQYDIQSAWYPAELALSRQQQASGQYLEDELDLAQLSHYLKQLANRYDVGDQSTQDSALSDPINDPDLFSVESRGSRTLYDLYTGDSVADRSEQQQQHNLTQGDEENYQALEAIKEILASSVSSSEPSKAQQSAGSEYIDRPLALAGHQYVQGGAGEGRQLLGPDGSFENVQVIKSDQAVPAYCEPPNPCPLGYTAANGCLERFVNSASFSREYQVKQRCSCDNEHSLFNCAAPVPTLGGGGGGNNRVNTAAAADEQGELRFVTEPDLVGPAADSSQLIGGIPISKLKTLARTIQNRFGGLESIKKLVEQQQQQQLAS